MDLIRIDEILIIGSKIQNGFCFSFGDCCDDGGFFFQVVDVEWVCEDSSDYDAEDCESHENRMIGTHSVRS